MFVCYVLFYFDSSVEVLLKSFIVIDVVVCCGDGVYVFNVFCSVFLELIVMVMENDCVE